jgi:hypothetical protein
MTELIVAGGLVPKAWLSSAEFLTALEQTDLADALRQFRWSEVEYVVTSKGAIAFTLGHEQYLQQRFGLAQIGQWYATQTAAQRPELAQLPWWRVDPVHLRLATDHISLATAQLSDVSANQADQLVASLTQLLDHNGGQIVVVQPNQWLLHLPELTQLQCTSSWAALGRSIDLYLPRNADQGRQDCARAWRRFCTEVEMSWFNHPVNLQRAAQGQLAINGVWLQGQLAPLTQSRQLDSQMINAQVVEATYSACVLEQPYEWVNAITQIPKKWTQDLAESASVVLILGTDFGFRRLRGTKPKWWQSKATHNWHHWAMPNNE